MHLMRVVFLIRSLEVGGTEAQLALLARGLKDRGHEVAVAVFYGGGAFERELRQAGVPIRDLMKKGRWDTLGFAVRMRRAVRDFAPDVVYSFLPEANVSAALLLLGMAVPIVFGVRASGFGSGTYDWLFDIVRWLEGWFCRRAALVIANSERGRATMIKRGCPGERIVTVANGVDISRFHPDAEARVAERRTLQLSPDTKLVAAVGRLDPLKDYPTFLRAATAMARRRGDLMFAIIGPGKPAAAAALQAEAAALGIGSRFRLLPARSDIARFYPAIDLLVLSSSSEGFPNVVAEAMACGVPAVATRVGDAAAIIGDESRLVAPGDSDGLAEAAVAALERTPSERPEARIAGLYSVQRMVAATESALMDAARRR